MFCTRCGSANPDEAQFCRNCSAPLVKRSSTPPSEPPYRSGLSVSGPGSTQPYSEPRSTEQGPYPGYAGPSGTQRIPPGYQPYQGYQSSYASYTPPLPQGASGRAIAAMVLSIISIFTCGPLLSIPGLILGKMEMNAIREGLAPQAGETFAKVGFYLGIAVTALSCLLVIFWAFFFWTAGTLGRIS